MNHLTLGEKIIFAALRILHSKIGKRIVNAAFFVSFWALIVNLMLMDESGNPVLGVAGTFATIGATGFTGWLSWINTTIDRKLEELKKRQKITANI